MKISLVSILALGLLAMPAPAQQSSAPAAPRSAPAAAPRSDSEKISYAIGVQLAEGIKSKQISVDSERVAQGLSEALSGAQLQMSESDISAAIVQVQEQLKAKADQARTAEMERNKAAGDAFLAENAKKEGVVTLPDGLQYKILTPGTGSRPTDDDT